MDIGSKQKYPAGALSNFTPRPFTFDDVDISSMEGFLQSLKFSSQEMQREICKLVGFAAKKSGSKKNWQRAQTLHWQGETIPRKSPRYQELLDDVYKALFDQNAKARKALLASGHAHLTHSIGRTNKTETVLTVQEFCSRLMDNRRRYQHDALLEELGHS